MRAILYSFRRCPYAMRARMAIAASGIQVELREVLLRNKPEQLLAISAKATVPVLLTSENTVIDESLDIMLWALNQSDPDHWLNNINNELITVNDGEFKHWLDRYKYADRYPEQSALYYRQQGEKILLGLEQQLKITPYLSGNNITFTDIAIFPFIRQFAFTELAWFEQSPYPKLRQWLNTHIESTLFQNVMHKYPPWQSNQKESVQFPI
ncbi:MAG: glutathione S-transferase [Methylophaga sp.]|nr:MAG: glutathione S-transferase [Methylophaga sp.]